jgi:5-methyltetrahydrofolate--homocysteine methyltransferase
MGLLTEINERLYEGDPAAVASLVQRALEGGLSAEDVLQRGLIAGMDRVGKDFRGEILFVPEVLAAAQAMHAGMNVLKPLLDAHGVRRLGRFVIGTVKGDLHDIGKSLVAMIMEGAGFEVLDLGIDTSAEKFVAAVQKYQPDLLGMSSLLTSTMDEMGVVVEALRQAGLRERVKVIVGGAPVTEAFAREIGADGYAPNASAAVVKSKELLGLS